MIHFQFIQLSVWSFHNAFQLFFAAFSGSALGLIKKSFIDPYPPYALSNSYAREYKMIASQSISLLYRNLQKMYSCNISLLLYIIIYDLQFYFEHKFLGHKQKGKASLTF